MSDCEASVTGHAALIGATVGEAAVCEVKAHCVGVEPDARNPVAVVAAVISRCSEVHDVCPRSVCGGALRCVFTKIHAGSVRFIMPVSELETVRSKM